LKKVGLFFFCLYLGPFPSKNQQKKKEAQAKQKKRRGLKKKFSTCPSGSAKGIFFFLAAG
jgi:hypothetical protein